MRERGRCGRGSARCKVHRKIHLNLKLLAGVYLSSLLLILSFSLSYFLCVGVGLGLGLGLGPFLPPPFLELISCAVADESKMARAVTSRGSYAATEDDPSLYINNRLQQRGQQQQGQQGHGSQGGRGGAGQGNRPTMPVVDLPLPPPNPNPNNPFGRAASGSTNSTAAGKVTPRASRTDLHADQRPPGGPAAHRGHPADVDRDYGTPRDREQEQRLTPPAPAGPQSGGRRPPVGDSNPYRRSSSTSSHGAAVDREASEVEDDARDRSRLDILKKRSSATGSGGSSGGSVASGANGGGSGAAGPGGSGGAVRTSIERASSSNAGNRALPASVGGRIERVYTGDEDDGEEPERDGISPANMRGGGGGSGGGGGVARQRASQTVTGISSMLSSESPRDSRDRAGHREAQYDSREVRGSRESREAAAAVAPSHRDVRRSPRDDRYGSAAGYDENEDDDTEEVQYSRDRRAGSRSATGNSGNTPRSSTYEPTHQPSAHHHQQQQSSSRSAPQRRPSAGSGSRTTGSSASGSSRSTYEWVCASPKCGKFNDDPDYQDYCMHCAVPRSHPTGLSRG